MSYLANFDPIVQDWFKAAFNEPSPPQNMGWPQIARGKNTLIFAPTGSGKTLAAFLWCINQIFIDLKKNSKRKNLLVHTLYVSPLKALNNDIERNLKLPLKGIWDLAKSKQIDIAMPKVAVRTGDTPPHIRQNMISSPPHILITTPESLYLMLTTQRGRTIFKNLQYLIVDEIHALTSNKRGVHLSFTLERLETLVKSSPVRIGLSATQRPLERIAAFLGGLEFSEIKRCYTPRPVEIVDCGQKKDLNVKVILPVKKFSDLPDSSVWSNVIESCYNLINAHKTTLIFVNMRDQTEKIVRQLNELHQKRTNDPEVVLAQAHHGSMSREIRYSVEDRLKRGKIPAVVATSSLELGIDIGSIDLVVHLEAPKSISGSIQRIGRSGHVMSATAKGRIMPLYPGDLDDAAALTRGILSGHLEESRIPESCLDVLSQQILAEVAMNPVTRSQLLHICYSSYCYRNISEQLLDNVLEMLEGRFADSKLPALQPIIVWDKVNQKITARKGARITAVMNSGTIPDRGYYSVILKEQNNRIGEVDEEFVFESRVGDIFFLGNSEWRIEEITNDRINVSPVKSVKPRPPFWKGEIPYRSYETSLITAEFRHQLEQRLSDEQTQVWLMQNFALDEASAINLIAYAQKQKALTKHLPSHKTIIAEVFNDSANEVNLIIHAGFGARVTGLWAIALSSAIEKIYQTEVQYTFNDDGFLIRLQQRTEKAPIKALLSVPYQEVEDTILAVISTTPIFTIQFRHNASRALLLPRSRQGKRIPLWLQRLRSADLLQAIRQYPDFPIIIETYRSCLHEIFDLQALKDVIDKINNQNIHIEYVETPYPSPMASGLIFNFLSYQMYDYDRARAPGDASAIHSEMLSQILDRQEIPAILDKAQIETAEMVWQHLAPHTKAKDVEELFLIIKKLGPISVTELEKRSNLAIKQDIQKLAQNNRIIQTRDKNLWMSTEYAQLLDDPDQEHKSYQMISHHMEVHGPVLAEQIARKLDIPIDFVLISLNKLLKERQVVKGKFIKADDRTYWCHRHNFAELYRRAINIRRKQTVAIQQQDLYRFLISWHLLPMQLEEVLTQYAFLPLDIDFFERDLLPSRGADVDFTNIAAIPHELEKLFSSGKYIIRCSPEKGKLIFHQRGQGAYLYYPFNDDNLSPDEQAVLSFLKEHGMSLTRDLEEILDFDRTQLVFILQSLTISGLISTNSYAAFKTIISSGAKKTAAAGKPVSKHLVRTRVSHNAILENAGWFLTSAFSVKGKDRSPAEQSEFQARLLLQRYGIVVKELYRREALTASWYDIFQVLKRLEWQAEIRRGYFVAGWSGVQFASHDAVTRLEESNTDIHDWHIIALVDPAMPLSVSDFIQISDRFHKNARITRNTGNHLVFRGAIPVAYLENYAQKIWLAANFENGWIDHIVENIKGWLRLPDYLRPKRKIEIHMINSVNASESEFSSIFVKNGFEKDFRRLVLWPSGV